MRFSKLSAVTFELLVPLFVSSVALVAAISKRALLPFVDPALGGGSMFIDTGNGLGEPMNVRSPILHSHHAN